MPLTGACPLSSGCKRGLSEFFAELTALPDAQAAPIDERVSTRASASRARMELRERTHEQALHPRPRVALGLRVEGERQAVLLPALGRGRHGEAVDHTRVLDELEVGAG